MNLAKKLLMTTGTSSGTVPTPSGGYVDDVFSTYLYTGNGATQTINNGIDLAGEGGLVWAKSRNVAQSNFLFDSVRVGTSRLLSDTTGAAEAVSGGVTFASSGYSTNQPNNAGNTYVSWTFRKAPKFFDVVTYTGNGVAGRQIAHSLGQTPGMIIVKRVSGTNEVGGIAGYWFVYHRSLANSECLLLNTTDSKQGASVWDTTTPTSTQFTVSSAYTNYNGDSYVAYLFAHDTSVDGIIQCGSFTTDSSGNATVNLGWEPQYVMYKASLVNGSWFLMDSMRGMPVGGNDAYLSANTANQEFVDANKIDPNATGFSVTGASTSTTYIYMTIRRPNKPPTSGTQVYNAIARTGTGAAATVTGVGFAPDLVVSADKGATVTVRKSWYDRLRGASPNMTSTTAGAEVADTSGITAYGIDGVTMGSDASVGGINFSGASYINWFFRRSPGFFDIVCDTGTGVAHAIAHNLSKAPELIIRKSRSTSTQWEVWHSALAATEKLVLNSNAARATDATAWNSTLPTATQFTVGTGANVNANTATFVTYLFSTLTGISKVGSYSGNGGAQTIPCGFTTGSRFILIKRIDNTGDWFVWDTTRGITPTTDPHLSLNTTAAEVTTDDSIDQDASGFIVNQNAATNINALGGNYLFLAIA